MHSKGARAWGAGAWRGLGPRGAGDLVEGAGAWGDGTGLGPVEG